LAQVTTTPVCFERKARAKSKKSMKHGCEEEAKLLRAGSLEDDVRSH